MKVSLRTRDLLRVKRAFHPPETPSAAACETEISVLDQAQKLWKDAKELHELRRVRKSKPMYAAMRSVCGKEVSRMITLAYPDNKMTHLQTWELLRSQCEARVKPKLIWLARKLHTLKQRNNKPLTDLLEHK